MAWVKEHWPWLVGALVLVLVIALGVWWWRKRRKNRPKPATVSKPSLDLVRVWRTFVKRMPREYRRSLPLFRPVVVFGEAGSGKSSFIDRATDWKGEAALFHPSYLDDPLLQVYQASRAVVLEVAPALLNDSSGRIRHSLVKLWRALRRHKSPRSVVVLSAAQLEAASAEELERLARAVRGKLDLLGRQTSLRSGTEPVPVSIAITHMDRLPGFVELASLMAEHNRAVSVRLDEEPLVVSGGLADSFRGLERYLPMLLRERGADEYARAQRLMAELPRVLRQVSTFVEALGVTDPRNPAPPVVSLGLTSERVRSREAWNPFTDAISSDDVQQFRPNRRHQFAAAALALVGLAVIGMGYWTETQVLKNAKQRIDTYTATFRDPASRTQLFDYLEAAAGEPARLFTPSFVPNDTRFVEAPVRKAFLKSVRDRVLDPELDRYVEQADGVRAIHLLALWYAGERNEIGRFLLAHREDFEEILALPSALVGDYVLSNERPKEAPLPLDDRQFAQRFAPDRTLAASDTVAKLERTLQDTMTLEIVTDDDLERLRGQVRAVESELDALDRAKHVARVAELVSAETGLDYASQWTDSVREMPDVDREAIATVQRWVSSADLQIPKDGAVDLLALLDALEADIKVPLGPEPGVSLASGALYLHTDWIAAIVRSRVRVRLDNFVRVDRTVPGELFLGRNAQFRGVDLGVGRASRFFPGGAKVSGIFTVRAYNDRVKPALIRFQDVLDKLPLTSGELEAFASVVRAAAEEYATAYSQAYTGLYDAFEYDANGALALRYALDDLTRPYSPLRKMLEAVSTHTSLDVPETNPYFAPFSVVTDTLGFARNLVPADSSEGTPVLDAYIALLGKLKEDLSASAEAGGTLDAAPGEEARLEMLLPPIGRVALGIHLEKDGNFDLLVDEWLTSADVPNDWRTPFTIAPRQAYWLGIAEVQDQVEKKWDQLVHVYVDPVRTSYPFRKAAKKSASVDQLTATFHPAGGFWTSFNAVIGPLVVQRRGRWAGKATRFSGLDLPSELLATANWVSSIRELLWDAKGEAIPVTVQAQPSQLPAEQFGGKMVVLTYLKSGATVAYGLNLRPDYTELEVTWWETGSASVGAAYSEGGDAAKIYRETSVSDTDWALFRLLDAAAEPPRSGAPYSWVVGTPLVGTSFKPGFLLRRDPRRPFRAEIGDKVSSL